MTTNDATARDAIVAVVDAQMIDAYAFGAGETLQTGDPYDIAMALIEHLWQAADDAGVQDAGTHTEHLLTAILGPRPTGENDDE